MAISLDHTIHDAPHHALDCRPILDSPRRLVRRSMATRGQAQRARPGLRGPAGAAGWEPLTGREAPPPPPPGLFPASPTGSCLQAFALAVPSSCWPPLAWTRRRPIREF
ncbi:uncharacterized protein LOC107497487 [Rousettus aegyptiacus]|uniref:uncharacterized protein LOC107497487 n=1 Tax=Rousettus aegyptiacus TaxID=9407 RepID=UPI00168CCCC8|nr:uncharacterized protein LOC107497487 [Rousettus aegyptiacus]